MELKNAKYQFTAENTEFKIPNLRYIVLFSQSIVFKTRILKRYSFYIRLNISQMRLMLIFYTLWKHQKTTDFWCFQGAQRRILIRNGLNNNNWRERHNLMLLAWNAISSIVKQNNCKNKATRLRSSIKRQTSGTSSDNEWQRMTTSGTTSESK